MSSHPIYEQDPQPYKTLPTQEWDRKERNETIKDFACAFIAGAFLAGGLHRFGLDFWGCFFIGVAASVALTTNFIVYDK